MGTDVKNLFDGSGNITGNVQIFSFAFFGATIVQLVVVVVLLLCLCCLVKKIRRLKRLSVNQESDGTRNVEDKHDPKPEENIPLTELPATQREEEDDDMYDSVVVPNKAANEITPHTSKVPLPEYDDVSSAVEGNAEDISSKKFSISTRSTQKSTRNSKAPALEEDGKGMAMEVQQQHQDEYAMVNKAGIKMNKEESNHGTYNTLVHCVESSTKSQAPICASKVFPDQYDSIGVPSEGKDRKSALVKVTSGGEMKPSSPPPPPLPPPISENDLPDMILQGSHITPGEQPTQYYDTVHSGDLSQVGQSEISEVFLANPAVTVEPFVRSGSVRKTEIQEDLYMNVN